MKGIYLLANDKCLDWLTAFLESAKLHASRIPIYIIPFDTSMESVFKLQEKYKFEVVEDLDYDYYDKIGASFFPERHYRHLFRKLSVFEGPLDQFFYIDVDIVLTASFDLLLKATEPPSFDADFAFYDVDHNWCYSDPEFREKMKKLFDSKAFNSGFFYSRKDAISKSQIEALIPEALDSQEYFQGGVRDQPVINFLVDRSINKKAAIFETNSELAEFTWAGLDNLTIELKTSKALLSKENREKQVPFIHWSGIQLSPTMPHFRFWLSHRLAGLDSFNERSVVISKIYTDHIKKEAANFFKKLHKALMSRP